MLPLLLLKGSLIGLSVSMPMGPIGMLCLRNSLIRGQRFGFASGIGIALAESLCVIIAVIGLSSLTPFIENNQTVLQLIGSLLLFYFGIYTLRSERKENDTDATTADVGTSHGYFRIFLLMFLLTMTNPLTLFSFVAIFSAIGTETLTDDVIAISLLALGVFIGSCSWWTIVSSSSSYFAGKIRTSSAKIINKVAGIFIIVVSSISFLVALNNYLTA